mmetsp:Transcript_12664/g.28059  ORF Transcript_12664/g.28059 Transcript_12664/m.28059 type:complete len:220 (+) Transcript_12664:510-1169(+)
MNHILNFTKRINDRATESMTLCVIASLRQRMNVFLINFLLTVDFILFARQVIIKKGKQILLNQVPPVILSIIRLSTQVGIVPPMQCNSYVSSTRKGLHSSHPSNQISKQSADPLRSEDSSLAGTYHGDHLRIPRSKGSERTIETTAKTQMSRRPGLKGMGMRKARHGRLYVCGTAWERCTARHHQSHKKTAQHVGRDISKHGTTRGRCGARSCSAGRPL